MERFERVSDALDDAAQRLRRLVQDATAPLAVLAPMHLNNAFARRALAEAGPQIRLYYFTPESLIRELSARTLAESGLLPQTPVRHAALVASAIDAAAAAGELHPHQSTLVVPGWKRVLAATIDRLESAGLSAEDLNSPDAADWIQERLRIVRVVLRRVANQRRELRVAGPVETRDAALTGVHDASTPCNEFAGAIVIGDRDLAVGTFEPVRQWLSQRPWIRVDVQPVDNVPIGDAPSLRSLGKPITTLRVAAQNDIGLIQRNLWQTTSNATQQGVVEFVRTPDEVRENEEVVRFIQRQIRNGTALDQIAVVLPDDAHREALVTAFDRAGIPVTWFVMANLAQGASGKFLMLALEMALGRQGVDTWYDLLRQRRLRLKARTESLTTGRGRWRRLLAECGSYHGAANIQRALQLLAQRCEDDNDRAAASSLSDTIAVVNASIEQLAEFTDLAGFARNCTAFLRDWWRHSADRATVLDVLRQVEGAGKGIETDLDVAAQQLREALEGTPVQQGHLSDASVRVLPPMAALGCDFEVVCVLGLVQGRLPRRRRPEPILHDEVLDALEQRHPGVHLRRNAALVEQRRFAAAISGARKVLWLSSPAFEGLAERPRIPSTFALDALATLIGRRASYRDINTNAVVSGSLAHPYPCDPDDAIGAREYLVAGLMNDNAQLAAQLTSHVFARNLLRLHLSLGSEELVAAATTTDPSRFELPALAGEPQRTRDLAAMLADPGGYFMRRVLRAYRPRRLRGAFSPLSSWWIDQGIATALQAALDTDGDFADVLLAEWEAVVSDAVALNDVDEDVVLVVRELGNRQSQRLATLTGGEFGEPVSFDVPVPLDRFQVQMTTQRNNQAELLSLVTSLRWDDRDELMLRLEVFGRQGVDLAQATSVEPSGKSKVYPRSKYAPDTLARLQQIALLLTRGAWAWGNRSAPWVLASDRIHNLKLDVLTELNGGGR